MRIRRIILFGCVVLMRAVAAVCALYATAAFAQVETYHVGRGGATWSSQADVQNGIVDVDGALQPLELITGQNQIQLLKSSGQTWFNGRPADFTKPGQPRAWSNDGPFNTIDGPLLLVDGNEATSTDNAFKTSRSQAGATFWWDLGAPFPIDRVRFTPDINDPDSFIKAFELHVADGQEFDSVNRPVYRLLRRVEDNREPLVELDFESVRGRFLRLKVLSRNAFTLSEFEIFGEGFVPLSSYVSHLQSFARPVNFGRLAVKSTRLGAATDSASVTIQLRSGSDDTPLAYFRRDRDTGVREEVSVAEYNNLPRRALFRRDPVSGQVLEEVSRAEYLSLPLEEVGPARDFVQADIREDVENWSSWTPPIRIESSGVVSLPLELPSPREFLQFRIAFDSESTSSMRIDSFLVEFAPELVSIALGEVGVGTSPDPEERTLAVPSGVDTTFVLDIRTEFNAADLAGFRGIKMAAFPPPVFERLEMGEVLSEVVDLEVESTDDGFQVFFPPVTQENNQPMRLSFRMRLLEYNTPLNAWLLGEGNGPPHPIIAGNASDAVGTGAINAFAVDAVPSIETLLSTNVLTPNGDGANDRAEIAVVLAQFADLVELDVEIFDLTGQRVRTLVAASRASGAYREVWEGRDDVGQMVAPGIYICQITVRSDVDPVTRTELIGVVY